MTTPTLAARIEEHHERCLALGWVPAANDVLTMLRLLREARSELYGLSKARDYDYARPDEDLIAALDAALGEDE